MPDLVQPYCIILWIGSNWIGKVISTGEVFRHWLLSQAQWVSEYVHIILYLISVIHVPELYTLSCLIFTHMYMRSHTYNNASIYHVQIMYTH